MIGLNSGLIGVRRAPTTSSASGIWTPNEQSLAKRATIWPRNDSYRYYRFANFAATSLNNNTIDLLEIELYDGNTKHTGITCTTSWTFTGGSASNIVDGETAGSSRAYYSGWSSIRATATIAFDLGSIKPVTYVKIFAMYAQPRFPASFDLQASINGSTYSTIASVTPGILNEISAGFIYASDKIAV